MEGGYVVGKIPRWSERLKKAPSRAEHVKNGIDLSETDYNNSLNVKLGTPAIRK